MLFTCCHKCSFVPAVYHQFRVRGMGLGLNLDCGIENWAPEAPKYGAVSKIFMGLTAVNQLFYNILSMHRQLCGQKRCYGERCLRAHRQNAEAFCGPMPPQTLRDQTFFKIEKLTPAVT